MNRREWLLGMTAAPAALSAAEGGTETYWNGIRRQFPLNDGLVYLNAANVCPASKPVLEKHAEFLKDFHGNPSFQNRDKYVAIYERLRGKLAQMFRVTPDEISLTRNTSEGANTIVDGLPLKAGDEIVLTAHNHPSNLDSWVVRAKREGLKVTTVPVPVPAVSVGALISSIEKALTPKTRVVSITHVTSTTGILYPAKEIIALAHKHGAWAHLDGAQSFGMLDVNLKDLNPDSYAGSAHKWPMGPLEAGVLYVKASRINEVWPHMVTAGWKDDLRGARKFEVLGQRDDPRVVAFESAIDFLNGLGGMAKVEARSRFLATRLKTHFSQNAALTLKTNMEPSLSGGVIKVLPKNKPLKQVYDDLYEKHRLALSLTASGDSAGIRFSPHIYNTLDDIDRAAEAVKKVLG